MIAVGVHRRAAVRRLSGVGADVYVCAIESLTSPWTLAPSGGRSTGGTRPLFTLVEPETLLPLAEMLLPMTEEAVMVSEEEA